MSIPTWTKIEEDTLKEMWADNKSARDIAKVLGPHYTRSAILGKISRMRRDGVKFDMRQLATKTGRPRNPRKPPNYNPAPRSIERLAPTPVASEPTVVSLFSNGVSILEATHGQCRAIVGRDDSTHRLAIFCGATPTVGKTSFCQGHFDRFYQMRIR